MTAGPKKSRNRIHRYSPPWGLVLELARAMFPRQLASDCEGALKRAQAVLVKLDRRGYRLTWTARRQGRRVSP